MAGPTHEGVEQPELHWCELEGLALVQPALARLVDGKTSQGARARGGQQRRRAGPPQQGLDAGHHLARAEGFADVVVRTQLQPEQAINFVNAGGQHDDRHGRKGAQLVAHLHAVQAWQHDVEQQQLGAAGVGLQAAQRLLAVAKDAGGKTLGLQVVVQHVGDVGVVFHNPKGGGGHG